MFEPYMPERFCRDWVELRNDSSQLVNFMSVVLGHKPLMDDWIAVDKLEAYQEMCARHGIHTLPDSVFVTLDKALVPAGVLGRDALTTTIAYGMPVGARAPDDGWRRLGARVHMFLSRDPDNLRHGMWYPLIVRNRITWPPRADILSYGRFLGYPPCCIAWFRKYNNWNKYSFLWEIRRNSTRLHPLCNPLCKDRSYSYIYHMPCSYSCEETVRRVSALREDIAAREPAFVAAIDRHLRLPALVFRERKIYFFEGVVRGNRIDYTSWMFEGGEATANVLDEALGRGDAVEVDGQAVRVLRGSEVLQEVICNANARFAPEVPFIALFGDD